MISKRGMVAAAATGAGVVLLATGTAFACNINDFTADATARCDTSTGAAKAAITVTDKDASGTPADITVRLRFADNAPGPVAGTAHIAHPTAEGVSTTILVDWMQGYSWYVSVTASGYIDDQQLSVLPTSADTPCEVPGQSTPSGTPTDSASPTPSGTPRATPSTPAAAAASPSSSVSPAGGTTTALAETGGGSNTGLIAGSAAALIAVGAGALFALRRRTATGRR
ncbi:LAETG motif-containing sortase-dependent surface protein [Streptomyces sp. NPDC059373]